MSGVHDDLVTLREELNACESAREQPWVAHTALARVEAEIARLEDDLDRERDNHAALLRINQHAAEQWEARCARLQQAIAWALGEGDSDFYSEHARKERGLPIYWWRTKLRALAGLDTPADSQEDKT